MSILMLSYHHLPLYLRPCFAFCSTFPQDHEFDKEDLVLKWMALGLVQHSPQNQGQALEDIGSYYFDELFNRSFFEQTTVHLTCSYSMHDLLHDVARSVSHGECFSIVDGDKSVGDIPNTVRHLYLATDNLNIVRTVEKLQQLRSLQLRIIIRDVLPELAEVLEKVVKSLKCVRMLEVCTNGVGGLPDVFGHLRHLRSLIIDFIDECPASLCKLHNLQVLKFFNDISTVLPENMKDLVSLRHLLTLGDNFPVIARVRKLASLRVLTISIKKERDYKIAELEGLILIRELHLQGLENVESPEEASMAKLGNKEHLCVLSLEWNPDNDTEGNDSKMDEQQQILDCLQPHSSLQKLPITGYKGVRPANWMDFALVNNLQRICLSDCSRLEQLPSFGKLPFLKYLYLWNMPLVKQLDCDCRQLEELYLDNMEGLEELSQPYANSGQWCPCLLQLRIQNSPKLSVFPSLSLGLQSMELSNVGSTALPNLCLGSESGEGSSSSLQTLEGMKFLPSLDSLSISYCKELMSPVVINALQHLGRLTIHGCPELVCTTTTAVATGLILAIDKLEIDDPMLLLTESFRNLTSLRELDISNCSKLESISGQMEEWLLQRRTTLNSLTLGKASVG